MSSRLSSRVAISSLRERFYRPDMQPGNQFSKLVDSYIKPDFWLLDAGCGKGSGLHLRGKCEYVVGYDLSDDVFLNTEIDAAIQGDVEDLKLPSDSFDLVACTWLMEHVGAPERAFDELTRVLKPGGRLLLVTPNIFHYSMLVSKFTPYKFHEWFLHKLGDSAHSHGFRTFYKANTRGKLKKLASRSGLSTEYLKMVEGYPRYMSFFMPAFILGIMNERLMNSWSGFSGIRHSILAVFRKEG